MIQPSFTSFQEQIRDEQEQYRELIEQYIAFPSTAMTSPSEGIAAIVERERYVQRLQQLRREIQSLPQTPGGPETNGASRNQQRRGRGRGRGRGRSRGVQGRGRQGHQSN